MFWLNSVLLVFLVHNSLALNVGLYPRESETRKVKLLNGFWNFRVIPTEQDQNIGFTQKWYSQPLSLTGDVIPMPVPSSFNDITQSRYIRDYAGWVWYDLSFFVPQKWEDNSVVLRFGSAHYQTVVYLNGVNVLNHTGGHLPFETYATQHLKYGEKNLITVAINNILSKTTIPQGGVRYMNDTDKYPKGFYEATTQFDFFNYAGIHRSVVLYALPKDHIQDITVFTRIKDSDSGVIDYSVKHSETDTKPDCVVDVFDKKGKRVSSAKGLSGSVTIPNAIFWWPFTMNQTAGYLYTLRISLENGQNTTDIYYLKVGIRTIQVKESKFLINGKEFYFRGFGKHEDANIRGKGLDLPIIAKDFNLIKWIGANSFRTSHYPYSEELMDMADEEGIVVIDECPAVGLSDFNDVVFAQHVQTIREMIQRDKNRASVVMWSIANEPDSANAKALDYFKRIRDQLKSFDTTRPITGAISAGFNADHMSDSLDVLMINRYWGWYQETGYPQVIANLLVNDLANNWFATKKKPIMISEYGADTVPGLHMDPAWVFSEDYQSELFREFFKAFDQLRAKGFFVGELVWNFADFMTGQSINRPIGNKKGIFTRDRQPKAVARLLKCRYWKLASVKTDDDEGFGYC